MKKYLVFIIGFLSWNLCSAHNSHSDHPHYKPGANLVFVHNYDGSSKPGEYDYLDLHFTSYSLADGESMKISLNPPDALEIVGSLVFEAAVSINRSVRVPVTLKATQEGRHYLGIQVEIVDIQGRHSFRVFELPIQVGEFVEKADTRRHKTVVTPEGHKLAILESTETIIEEK